VTKEVDGDDLLLRGQRCRDWDMVPSLSRLKPRTADITLIDVEQRLVSGFKRQSLPHLQRDLKDERDVLAMAQHHGLATRLLDWTSNPFSALWFAVREQPITGCDGVVFVYSPARADYVDREELPSPYKVKRTLFFQPSHLTPRIVAQQG
jgi:hypothetical protein